MKIWVTLYIIFFTALYALSEINQDLLQYYSTVLPPAPQFESWLASNKTALQEIEFLPTIPGLPDPLKNNAGAQITSANQWLEQKANILELFQQYVFGLSPQPPVKISPTEFITIDNADTKIYKTVLRFGPANSAKLTVELIVPKTTVALPVFLTQSENKSWATLAAQRGFIGCTYAACETEDDTSSFTSILPTNEWPTISRYAWAASRCIDYLHQLEFVDKSKIALVGQALCAKACLWAAAQDPRINAVICINPGPGGAGPWRFTSEHQLTESLEIITRKHPDWFHPGLRLFAGKEFKLPVDQHELLACIAPRPVIISLDINDPGENLWAIERACSSAQKVYSLLQAPNQIFLRHRYSKPMPTNEDIESFIDWLNAVFYQKIQAQSNQLIFPQPSEIVQNTFRQNIPLRELQRSEKDLLSFENGTVITSAEQWNLKQQEILRRIVWALGDPPPNITNQAKIYQNADEFPSGDQFKPQPPMELTVKRIRFGNQLLGDLYIPSTNRLSEVPLPAVIWVHPISPSRGYQQSDKSGEPIYIVLAKAGFATFAFDQIGNGSRIDEIKEFYNRYPNWSILGKTTYEISAAIDCLTQLQGINPEKIYLVGFSTGGMIALHSAALDRRIAGVVVISGLFQLNNTDINSPLTELWQNQYPFQPRLTWLSTAIPGATCYSEKELIAVIAPRHVVIVAPVLSSMINYKKTISTLESASKVFSILKADANLQIIDPNDYDHLSSMIKYSIASTLSKIVRPTVNLKTHTQNTTPKK